MATSNQQGVTTDEMIRMLQAKNADLTEQIKELNKALEAKDDIIYELLEKHGTNSVGK